MFAIVFFLNVYTETQVSEQLSVPLDVETNNDGIINPAGHFAQVENNLITGIRMQPLPQHNDLSTIKRFKNFIKKHSIMLQIISFIILIFLAFYALILYNAAWYTYIQVLIIIALVFSIFNGLSFLSALKIFVSLISGESSD